MPFYFSTVVQSINTASVLIIFGYAIWRGRAPERWAAALLLTAWLATPLLQTHDPFRHAEISIFVTDGILTLALAGLGMTSDRFWPLWATAFQLLEMLMHVAMLVDHGVRPRAYFIGMEISSYLVLAALAVGTWLETPNSKPRANLLASSRASRSHI